MDPHYLGILVMVGTNKSKFMPSVKEIKERYYFKFRGKGGEHDEPGRRDQGGEHLHRDKERYFRLLVVAC